MSDTKKKTNQKNGKDKPGKKIQRPAPDARKRRPVRREVWGIVCLLLAVISLLGCFGVESFFTSSITDLSKGLFGGGYAVMPVSLAICFAVLMFHDGRPVRLRVVCALLISVILGAVVHAVACKNPPEWSVFPMLKALYLGGLAGETGGAVSGLIATLLIAAISKIGTMILLIILLLLSLLTSLNMTVLGIIRAIRQRPRLEYDAPQKEHADPAKVIVDHVANKRIERQEKKLRASEYNIPIDGEEKTQTKPQGRSAERKKVQSPDEYLLEQSRVAQKSEPMVPFYTDAAVPASQPVPAEEPMSMMSEVSPEVRAILDEEPQKIKKEEVHQETIMVAQEIEENIAEEKPQYIFPSVDLLRSGSGKSADGTEEMRLNTARLNDTLSSFGIDAHIINVVRGPSVTRYELELDRGVKLSKITGLADDIALSLGASGVRISAIPDKISVVGIEVPNKTVSVVLARDVIDSDAFSKNQSSIAFAVGRDIGGNSIVGDIAKLPHMLIAGTTGSGKSVCMNSLIISLLYKSSPDQVRMIMIDPKMVELGVYNGIPHLLIPVVTDPKKAAGSLQWGVCEMMRRYRMMADAGTRDLKSYNKIAAVNPELETMPQIVVVIDELADLMLVAAKEVEESICRIAQMGRAAGIHLVIATQRPSADVITGLMKANIPSRIAFAVASAMESRIILDTQGAEKLVGKGDMLYAPLGQGKPKRVQGCFISDEEVQRVVDFITKESTANYDSDVLAQIEENSKQSGKQSSSPAAADSQESDGACDEMLTQAVDVIMETGQASVSMLQRRLKLGYARAARIVDEMEERGIVGPFSGSKPRELLITKEQWEAMKNGGTNPPVEEEID